MSGQQQGGSGQRGEQQSGMYNVPPPYQLATAAQLAGTSYGAYAGAPAAWGLLGGALEFFAALRRSVGCARTRAPASARTHSTPKTRRPHSRPPRPGMAGPPGAPMLIPYGIPGECASLLLRCAARVEGIERVLRSHVFDPYRAHSRPLLARTHTHKKHAHATQARAPAPTPASSRWPCRRAETRPALTATRVRARL